jgi:hypothetical protein
MWKPEKPAIPIRLWDEQLFKIIQDLL